MCVCERHDYNIHITHTSMTFFYLASHHCISVKSCSSKKCYSVIDHNRRILHVSLSFSIQARTRMAQRKCVSCHHCVPYCRYRSITDTDRDTDTNSQTHTHTHARTHTHISGNIYIYVRILNTKQSGTWQKWRVMLHTSMGHVAHMHWSCRTHKSSMSTHELEMSHT